MKYAEETKSLEVISEDRTEQILQICTNSQTTDGEINKTLLTLLLDLERITVETMEKALEEADYIADSLRNEARRNKCLRFYYYGMYQAKLEIMRQQFYQTESEALQNKVIHRKNFARIMEVLSSVETIRHTALARALDMDSGNLSREMNLITEAGFAEERKTQKIRFYCLSPMGAKYCEKHPFKRKHDNDRRGMVDGYVLVHDEVGYPEGADYEHSPSRMLSFPANEPLFDSSYKVVTFNLEELPDWQDEAYMEVIL